MNDQLLSTERDYLEMLLHKLSVMKRTGSQFYAHKMNADKKIFDAARKDVNEFIALLLKRGYNPKRFDTPPPKQTSLL